MLSELHFLRPWWLLAILPLAVLLIWFARRRFEQRRWQNIVDEALMPHVLIGAGYQSRRTVTAVIAIAGVLLLTALAGPVWQRVPQPVFRNLDALVIALDLSRSMDVADITPSRLARARFKINDILQRRSEGQTALLVYAAEPYVISPLTDDTKTIIAQLPALATELMPSQGSRADRALEKARELMQQAGVVNGQILLVTDGVNVAQTAPLARQLAAAGIRTSVLGVGTSAGGPIPGQDGFIKQSDGSIVIVKLAAADLETLAREGNGEYRSLSANDSDVDSLLREIAQQPEDSESTGLQADVWREEGPWLLLPLLPLAALAFRRGVLAVWLLVFFLPVQQAKAFDTNDWWSRADQRASRLLAAGDAAAAADVFVDPAWKAAAAYQAGRYEDSVAALEGLDDIAAIYNRGNALAKLQRFDAAIAAYEEVLERDAEHRDARYNLDLLKKLQQQQDQKNQQNQQNQQDQQQEQQDQQQGQQSGEQGENPQQDQQGDQQQQEQQSGQQGDGQQQSQQGQDQQQGQQQQDQQQGQGEPQENSAAENSSATDTPQSEADAQAAESTENTAGDSPEGEEIARSLPGTDEPDDAASSDASAAAREQPLDEDAQAAEQWLRKIPDDPGGLLRRKFNYQYQQSPRERPEEEAW